MSDGASIWPAVTGPGPGGAQGHALGALGVHAQRQLLDVEHDVDDVLAHALERGELVHHAVDLDGGDGRALQRGQQHPAQGVAERHAEAPLERLGDDARLARASAPVSICGFSGRISSFQFRSITDLSVPSNGFAGRAGPRAGDDGMREMAI